MGPSHKTEFLMTDHVIATYLCESRSDPEKAAIGLCREQSVSCSPGGKSSREDSLIRDCAAKLVDIEILSERDCPSLETYVDMPCFGTGHIYTRFLARIAFPLSNFRSSIAALINSIAGEPHHLGYFSALKLLDVDLPSSYTQDFKGPRFGVRGIRDILGIYHRPLFCAPVKPSLGLTPDEFADQAYKALKGGIDIVKDDELIVNPDYCHFDDRIRKTMDVVKKVEDETGRKRFYVVHISAQYNEMKRYYNTAIKYGADALMISPMIVGFPSIQWLSLESGLPIFSHNACMTMATRVPFYGIALHVLVKLQRLAGADVVVIPSPWGSFVMDEKCHRLNIDACLSTFHEISVIFPGFSGGKSAMTLRKCYESVDSEDFIIVVGSALFYHPLGVEAGARSLIQGWEAIMQGVEIEQYAIDHKELQATIRHFHKQNVEGKSQDDVMGPDVE